VFVSHYSSNHSLYQALSHSVLVSLSYLPLHSVLTYSVLDGPMKACQMRSTLFSYCSLLRKSEIFTFISDVDAHEVDAYY